MPSAEQPAPSAITRADAVGLDRDDPLAECRGRFALPSGVIYLDGNSLGALPAHTAARLTQVIENEWGAGLIRSWNDAGWFDKPTSVGDRLAPLIGADAGEVLIAESTSTSLYSATVAAARLRPERATVVSHAGNFPTDLYILEAVQRSLGLQRRLIEDPSRGLAEVLDDDVAVVVLTHVDYRTGRMLDLPALTRQVHEVGALVVWDLCHSVGAVPLDLSAAGADFAVGCTYKYLNGGPGSPSFLYCARRHQAQAEPPLSGWQGHARPFDFTPDYQPADGISRFRIGTPQLLSLAGLEASLDIWADVDLLALRRKSLSLTGLFMDVVEARLPDLEIVTPRSPEQRGSQVSLRHRAGAFPIVQALIERGVIGDFRAPDLMRFGFAPLYLSHADVWDAAATLADVVTTGVWREDRLQQRGTVT